MPVYFEYLSNDLHAHHTRDDRPRPDDHPMHAHEMYELFLFIEGKGRYFVEGNEYPLIPGSLLMMRPGETHHLKISPAHPYQRIVVHFAKAIISPFDPGGVLCAAWDKRSLGEGNLISPGEYNEDFVRSCLNFGGEDGTLNGRDREIQRIGVIANFLPVLFEIYKCSSSPESGIQEIPDTLINTVVKYINVNLTEAFSLSSLSEMFSMSKSYLNNRFKQITGTTIWKYITLKRLMLARQMIREGIPAAEAAADCGWSDYASFYRRYKSEFGTSPSDDKNFPKG